MKNTKGFTMIELLAVIIILGVLLIIAVPSVTSYISDSRKNSYIDTAQELLGSAKHWVNSGEFKLYDPDTTYYIPISCFPSENGARSPYGEFDEAYIGVIYNGDSYSYFWISVDTAGQGVKDITSARNLRTELIVSGIDKIEVRKKVDTTGIGTRTKILIMNEDCETWEDVKETKTNITEDGELIP